MTSVWEVSATQTHTLEAPTLFLPTHTYKEIKTRRQDKKTWKSSSFHLSLCEIPKKHAYEYVFPLRTWFTSLSFGLSVPSGITLTSLQLALKFAGLAYIPAFTKIYQRTLDWFPGFVFMLSSIFTVLGMIPIRYGVDDIMLLAMRANDLFLWLNIF